MSAHTGKFTLGRKIYTDGVTRVTDNYEVYDNACDQTEWEITLLLPTSSALLHSCYLGDETRQSKQMPNGQYKDYLDG